MICIASAFSIFLLATYGAVITAKWVFNNVRKNRENLIDRIKNTVFETGNTEQNVKVRVNNRRR